MFDTPPLWTAQEVAVATSAQYTRPWYADGLQIDSREVMIGDMFVALCGDRLDGHNYVAEAFERGAVAALVSTTNINDVDPTDPRLLLVEDTGQALRKMAQAARVRAPADVIAVTGSVGKTTITHGLRELFAHQAETHASARSFNNHVGVPVSLARMARHARYAIFEAGMSSPGEIAERAELIRPNIAVITTVGSAHRGNFNSEHDIAAEKASILTGLMPGGVAVLGIDHAHADYLLEEAQRQDIRVITVSAEQKADVHIRSVSHEQGESRLCAEICGEVVEYALPHVGNIWAFNSLLMLAVVKAAGGDIGLAAASLAKIQPPAGRGRIYQLDWPVGDVTMIDDSYNANPQSVAAALDHLEIVAGEREKGGKRIAILGDMLDLGDHAESAHRELAKKCAAVGVDLLITLGELANITGVAATAQHIHARSIVQARQILMENVGSHDVVLVKGSNAGGLSRLAEMLKNTDRFSMDWPLLAEV